MMKLLRISFLASLLVGWATPACFLASIPKSNTIKISIEIPQASLDLTDLEVRDEFNRPVNSPAAREKLKALFTKNLSYLLSFNLTPYVRTITEIMSRSYNAFAGWLTNKIEATLATAVMWWSQRKDRPDQLSFLPMVPPIYNVASGSRLSSERSSFLHLISSLISSTVLLR